jgi:hypothetical protein
LGVTELPHYALSKTLPADSYFTSEVTAQKCLSIFLDKLVEENIDIDDYTFIEPGAGNGAFFDLLPKDKRIGVDVIDRRDDIITADYLTWAPEDKGKYLTVGNPPFGVRGAVALAFVNRSLLFSEYVGFILPMSFHSNGKGTNMKRVTDGHLIHSQILEGESYFSPDSKKTIKVNTLFQIWKRGHGPSIFPEYDVSEYADIFTVCDEPSRRCGMDKVKAGLFDFYVSGGFYGDTLKTVYKFDDLNYLGGYGTIIKKAKEQILPSIKNIEWNNYASLATNSCKHIRRYHIQKCLFDLGYGIEVKCTTLEPYFVLDKYFKI